MYLYNNHVCCVTRTDKCIFLSPSGTGSLLAHISNKLALPNLQNLAANKSDIIYSSSDITNIVSLLEEILPYVSEISNIEMLAKNMVT